MMGPAPQAVLWSGPSEEGVHLSLGGCEPVAEVDDWTCVAVCALVWLARALPLQPSRTAPGDRARAWAVPQHCSAHPGVLCPFYRFGN